MAKKAFNAGQLIPTSSTPPSNAGFYRIDKNTIGVVGNLVQKDAQTNVESNVASGSNLGAELRSVTRDLLADKSWVRPIHLPVLDPRMHIGMAAITSGVLTISHDPAVAEFCSSSIKVAMSGSGTSVTARLPLSGGAEAGVSAQPIRIGPAIHVRIKCTDWTQVTRLYINFTQDGGTTNYYLAQVINGSKSFFGLRNAAYASAWSGFRTLVFIPSDMTKVGSPAAYGDAARYFNVDGIAFSISCNAAVDFHINRIYSVDWPVGVVCPILDGAYKSARDILIPDFVRRGWGFGASGNAVDGVGINPTINDLVEISRTGNDVFCHGHYLSGSGAAPLTTGVTKNQFVAVLSAQRRAFLAAGVSGNGMRWHQWLTNEGLYSGNDMAGVLREFGINAGRADTTDAEFGIDPKESNTQTGSNIFVGSYANKRGRFNRAYMPSYTALSPSHNDEYAYDVAGTMKKGLASVAALGLVMHTYVHQILETPGPYDIGLNFYRDWMADMDEAVRLGKILVLKPTDLERLTYWRSGETFMRWDGEWVYRQDPTTIAF